MVVGVVQCVLKRVDLAVHGVGRVVSSLIDYPVLVPTRIGCLGRKRDQSQERDEEEHVQPFHTGHFGIAANC